MSLISAHALMMAQSGGTDPLWASVVSLLHFDGTDGSTTFTDEVGTTTWSATSGAQIDSAESKFGSTSGWFPSSINSGFGNITSNTSAGFAFGTGDFTIEGWLRLNVFQLGFRMIMDSRPTGTNGFYPTIFVDSNTIVFFTNSAARITSTGGAISTAGVWQHFALCRASGTSRMFVNGSQVGSSYADSNNYVNQRFRFGNTGSSDSANNALNGWLDECRITKAARYTSNFTPPSAPFPNS